MAINRASRLDVKTSNHYTERPSRTYLRTFDQLYGSRKQHFQRDLLPEPLDFYTRHLQTLKGNDKWVMALCPFHQDHTPSLSIDIEKGAYRCFACGARGGGVVDFYMQLHDVGFKTAAKALGAWGTE